MNNDKNVGKDLYNFCARIFPICRSITGSGVRKTHDIIREIIPITTYEIETGKKAYDWQIPKEWNVSDAFIEDSEGNKVVDFKKNNLHLVGYSSAIDETISRNELNDHLHSIKAFPNAIPYMTSYYNKTWGFCISDNERKKIKGNSFKVLIDSELKNGSLTYGEFIIPGETKKEVLISTYTCHPSMANNECSGIAVSVFLAKFILNLRKHKFTYRFIFSPETIGSIFYINKNFDHLKSNVIAALNLTCVGDNNSFSLMPSRLGNTYADKIARYVMKNYTNDFIEYSFLQRGSDERQYCHPLIDLPMVSMMRSKYGEYKEYHTSLDDMNFISPVGLLGGYSINKKFIDIIESNDYFITNLCCEPMMSKRNLYPKDWNLRRTSKGLKINKYKSKELRSFLYYCDGNHDLVDIANILNIDFDTCLEYSQIYLKEKIIRSNR
jgi:aminopeptidase-like protein